MRPTEYHWKQFSRAYRSSKANMFGFCTCYTCGHIAHWKEFDTGHFIDRRYEPVKYNLLNVKPQCRNCNRLLDGNIPVYRINLLLDYDVSVVDYLNWAKLNVEPLNKEEVIWLTKHLQMMASPMKS